MNSENGEPLWRALLNAGNKRRARLSAIDSLIGVKTKAAEISALQKWLMPEMRRLGCDQATRSAIYQLLLREAKRAREDGIVIRQEYD